jgi:acetyl-CoA acetyltransferase
MNRSRTRQACVVGIGQSDYARRGTLKRTELDLEAEAIASATADAGLITGDIDGLASFASDAVLPGLLQASLGIPFLRWASVAWGPGGEGSCASVAHAVAAIESGACENVAVVRGLCQVEGQRYGSARSDRVHASYNDPFGLFAPAPMVALAMRRHMHLFGTDESHLAEIAVTCRDNAGRNPHAVMRGRPMTSEDHARSRMIADPFRLFDCCLETDGACALVLTTAERAADLRQPLVHVLAARQGSPPIGAGALGGHNAPEEWHAGGACAQLAAELYAAAGVTAADVDVAQLYDAFTAMVVFELEDYGFCERGGAGDLLASGAARWPHGRIPINTAGGNLSEAYVHGLNHVLEGVRQIRGTSTSQVAGAEVALVTSAVQSCPPSALILSQENH